MKSLSSSDVRRAAMDLLARREHGFVELTNKLHRRFSKYVEFTSSQFSEDDVTSDFPTDEVASHNVFVSDESVFGVASNVIPFDRKQKSNEERRNEERSHEERGVPEPAAPRPITAEQLGQIIEDEVSKLAAEGLQSDARLAEAFIRARANRGQGPMKIKMELRQKGIDDHLINLAMEEAELDWLAIAIEVAEKKFVLDDPDPRLRAKRQRFLQQRGFSFDQISAIERR